MKRNIFLGIAVIFFTFAAAPAKDPYPRACVDCHSGKPAPKLSVSMKTLAGTVPPALLKQLQPAAPKGVTLKGKHPAVPVKDVPASCLKCHGTASKTMPPLYRMMHLIHSGKAECANCHKFDATGQPSVPSATES